MFETKIMLKSFDDVKNFVDVANLHDYDIDLLFGKYIVNAKSIMGVFSIDLTKPITMRAYCDNSAEIHKQVLPFIFEETKY